MNPAWLCRGSVRSVHRRRSHETGPTRERTRDLNEIEEQRDATAALVIAILNRTPERPPTMAVYARIFASLGRPLPTAEELRSWGIPVRDGNDTTNLGER